MCVCSAFGYLLHFPEKYETIEKLYLSKCDTSYYIQSYHGNIELDNTSKFNITLLLDNPEKSDTIKFRLDNCFSITNIQHDDISLSYEREGDYVVLNLSELYTKNIELTFNYYGNVAYYSNSYNIDIFTTPYSSALPSRFAFLPTIDNEKNVFYNLTVSSLNTVISNLDIELIQGEYLLTGESDTICLFSGYFDSWVEDSTIIYRAKYNKITNYSDILNNSKKVSIHNQYNNKIEGGNYKYKKIFLIYYFYDTNGFPIKFLDYMMMNYGYIM